MANQSGIDDRNKLESNLKSDYSNEVYHTSIMEQYKLYAEILDQHHNRFMNTIKFFISIQFIFLSGFLIIIKKEVVMGIFGIIMLLLSGIFICAIWLMISKSHYKLTTAKHETLEEMETYLPLKPFFHEWHEKLKSGNNYINMRTVLFALPVVMSIIYISLAMVAIYG
ncbi:RipA family octameric membrane protein [Zobellia galactanivorans]|uniref:Hypothetical membrane protein n=1 Tax=Zobellia galactanivorans (strain DSM 12802 / CCUG 47099 / CIP 106680 / NCIMB 13871 / Dsij) TaxID=63186 RepID=G0L6P5_ZOBGA|nr:hypothetical protein [Zobellia galactanivorans]CAZ98566.1 Hypothetical membrane protein [Zobellia galactanivorans]